MKSIDKSAFVADLEQAARDVTAGKLAPRELYSRFDLAALHFYEDRYNRFCVIGDLLSEKSELGPLLESLEVFLGHNYSLRMGEFEELDIAKNQTSVVYAMLPERSGILVRAAARETASKDLEKLVIAAHEDIADSIAEYSKLLDGSRAGATNSSFN